MYIVTPNDKISTYTRFQRVCTAINTWFLKVGYQRAANELARMGYYRESKSLINEIKKLG